MESNDASRGQEPGQTTFPPARNLTGRAGWPAHASRPPSDPSKAPRTDREPAITEQLGDFLRDAARTPGATPGGRWRLTPAVPGDSHFEVSLDATRSESASGDAPPEHGIMLKGAMRW